MIDADKTELLKVVKEISASMSEIEAAREFIKDQKNGIAKKLELDKKVLSKVIKAYHKGNKDEEKAVFEEFETLYDEVVPS